jgi:hypothetical protein
MFGTSAPYVITVLMSVITWVLSTYYEHISTTPYLRYETSENGRDASPPYVVYRFTNVSPKVRISDVTLGLDCPGDDECFGTPGSDINTYAQMLKVPPWAMTEGILPNSLSIAQKIDLPAGTAFEIRAVLRSRDVEPVLYFQSKKEDQKIDLKLVRSWSLDTILANNFLGIVSALWILCCVIIFISYKNANTSGSQKAAQDINLKITRG